MDEERTRMYEPRELGSRSDTTIYKPSMVGETSPSFSSVDTWSPTPLNPYAPAFSSNGASPSAMLLGGAATPDMFQGWRSSEKLSTFTSWSSRETSESRNSSSDLGTPRDSEIQRTLSSANQRDRVDNIRDTYRSKSQPGLDELNATTYDFNPHPSPSPHFYIIHYLSHHCSYRQSWC